MKTKLILAMVFLLIGSLVISGLSGCSSSARANPTTPNSFTLEERNNDVASTATHVAAIGLGQALKDVSDETERVKLIQDYIDPIRFFNDQSGYFYVYYYNCVNLAHAIDKTLPGKDLSNYQDSKGLLVIQELSKKSKEGGGIVIFWWPHPSTKEVERKIGYVEPIPGTDYFIGTGYYPTTR